MHVMNGAGGGVGLRLTPQVYETCDLGVENFTGGVEPQTPSNCHTAFLTRSPRRIALLGRIALRSPLNWSLTVQEVSIVMKIRKISDVQSIDKNEGELKTICSLLN